MSLCLQAQRNAHGGRTSQASEDRDSAVLTATVNARRYLESQQLVPLTKELLHDLLTKNPLDPFQYLLDILDAKVAQCRELGVSDHSLRATLLEMSQSIRSLGDAFVDAKSDGVVEKKSFGTFEELRTSESDVEHHHRPRRTSTTGSAAAMLGMLGGVPQGDDSSLRRIITDDDPATPAARRSPTHGLDTTPMARRTASEEGFGMPSAKKAPVPPYMPAPVPPSIQVIAPPSTSALPTAAVSPSAAPVRQRSPSPSLPAAVAKPVSPPAPPPARATFDGAEPVRSVFPLPVPPPPAPTGSGPVRSVFPLPVPPAPTGSGPAPPPLPPGSAAEGPQRSPSKTIQRSQTWPQGSPDGSEVGDGDF